MKKTVFLRTLISLVFLICTGTGMAFAEQLANPTYGYGFDLPEGFSLYTRDSGGTAYLFTWGELGINIQTKIQNSSVYKTPYDALTNFFSRNNAKGEVEKMEWHSQEIAVGQFDMSISGYRYSGYAEAVALANKKGILIMAGWCNADKAEGLGAIIISALDSLTIDKGAERSAGIFTTYLYPDGGDTVDLELEIDGHSIKTSMAANSKDASEYVIDREYAILTLYAQHPDWQKAWTRYYRMIYRDSSARLSKAAFDIFNELAPYSDDDTDLAQKLLYWVQNFDYEREKTDSDFASLPAVLMGEGSDCDSRSMLLAVLLRHMNMDTVIFVSAEYSHAMAGLISTHPGQTIPVGSKKYLMGETTAKGLTWGKISQDMSDLKKWIPVEFE